MTGLVLMHRPRFHVRRVREEGEGTALPRQDGVTAALAPMRSIIAAYSGDA